MSSPLLLEKAKIDDAVGAAPVHLANGIWGVLAVGIFANGNPDTALWNGIETPVTGLLYGGGGQFIAQVFEAVAVGGTVFVSSFIFFKILAAVKTVACFTRGRTGRVGRSQRWARMGIPKTSSRSPARKFTAARAVG